MAIRESARKPPKEPAYVLQWVGRRVLLPPISLKREGLVTSVTRKRVVDASVIYAHVVIDDGGLWIGNAAMLTVLADRTTQHKECDDHPI